EELLRAEGSWFHPHPWLTLFLPDNSVQAIVEETVAHTTRPDLGDSGVVLLYPLQVDRLSTPLLRVPPSGSSTDDAPHSAGSAGLPVPQ
ncbi:MAG: FAD-binding protein, partial [Pseudonocardiaceae bacterium]